MGCAQCWKPRSFAACVPPLSCCIWLFLQMRVGVIAGDRLRKSCYSIKYVWTPPHQHSFFPLTLPSSLAGLTHHTNSLVGDGGLRILVAVAPTVSHVAVPRVGVAGPIFMCLIQLALFSNSCRRISSSVTTSCFCAATRVVPQIIVCLFDNIDANIWYPSLTSLQRSTRSLGRKRLMMLLTEYKFTVPYNVMVPGPLPQQPCSPTVGARYYRHTTRCLIGPNAMAFGP
jgi:hypothetical protein